MIHAANLGHRLMGLVNHHNKVIREIIDQSMRRLSWLQAGQMPGIVFDSRTEASLPHHLNVKIGTLGDSLGLQKFPPAPGRFLF